MVWIIYDGRLEEGWILTNKITSRSCKMRKNRRYSATDINWELLISKIGHERWYSKSNKIIYRAIEPKMLLRVYNNFILSDSFASHFPSSHRGGLDHSFFLFIPFPYVFRRTKTSEKNVQLRLRIRDNWFE